MKGNHYSYIITTTSALHKSGYTSRFSAITSVKTGKSATCGDVSAENLLGDLGRLSQKLTGDYFQMRAFINERRVGVREYARKLTYAPNLQNYDTPIEDIVKFIDSEEA